MANGQRPAKQLDLAQRRARVVAYFAERPTATERDAARDLDLTKSTVHNDIKAARDGTIGRAANDYVTAMVQRNEAIIGAFMPFVLRRGSVPHAHAVLTADRRTAELLGLDAAKKIQQTLDVNVRQIAEGVAADTGTTYETALAEVEAVLAEARR